MNELDSKLRPMSWWLARWVDAQSGSPMVLENWIVQALSKAEREAAQIQLRWEGERRQGRAGR